MAENRGKKFEQVVRESFERVKNTKVIRLPDPTNGYLGIRNISDFIVYHYPNQYFIECKSIHGNTFPIENVTRNQREGMLEAVETYGVIAGVLIWWVDKDVTKFVPIQELQYLRQTGHKSIRYDTPNGYLTTVYGRKKRVFFDYDMDRFFKEVKMVGYDKRI